MKSVVFTNISRLPAPTTEAWEWQVQAACRGMDSSHFFHPWGERDPRRSDREERAKAICGGCPVIDICASHALKVPEQYGIWGGMSEEDRLVLRNRSRRRRRQTSPSQPESDLTATAR